MILDMISLILSFLFVIVISIGYFSEKDRYNFRYYISACIPPIVAIATALWHLV